MRTPKNTRRKVLITVAVTAPSVLLLTVAPGAAYAHGTLSNPASRALVCRDENPESPKSAACKQAVAIGGTQALYDWNEVNIPDAAGRHRQIIPDGKLCSAGRDKYKGLDQARADWPATTVPADGRFTFGYRATAPHRGTFEIYVTRNGYDPAKPLKWSDLENAPFHTATDPKLVNGSYVMDAGLPSGKKGRHLIYTIWQRSDSPEAFYSCSDVIFGSGSGGGTTPTAAPTRSPVPGPAPTPTGGPGGHGGHDGAPGKIRVGIGVEPAAARAGQNVTVTAICSGSRVTSVSSHAFAPRAATAPASTAAWYPTLKVARGARPGAHAVYVTCADGGLARTRFTVTG